MSYFGFQYQQSAYNQCVKEIFPNAENLTEVFTKVNNEHFQNCLVRYHESYRVVANEVVRLAKERAQNK